MSRLFYSEYFFIRFAIFEILSFFGKYFPKNALSQKGRIGSKKRFWIKKTRNYISRFFYSEHVFDPIRCFRGIKLFLENILQKTLYLKNVESDQKKVLNKKHAELNFSSFLFRTFFRSNSPLRDITLFLENIFQKTLENGESEQKKFWIKRTRN